jgi:TonB-linked SusC/RagA family outer membrane protein
MKLLVILTFLIANLGTVYAQETIIKGKITEQNGDPLSGVNVVEKGTFNGTATDDTGNYSIALKNKNAVLVYSYIGFLTAEISVTGKTVIDIKLVADMSAFEEVVTIGYGTVKKKDLTGAISVVNSENMKNVQALSVGEVLQGLASGVRIRSNGNIGSEPDIKIRGIGNFGNSNPLYVIDGLISTGGIRDLNVNDIESVQILKDASAAAIYGNRAANGVIIITTKNGTKGEMKVDLSLKYSIDKLPKLNMMDTTEFFFYNDMAYANAGLNPQNHFNNSTDWEKEVLKTGYTQDYNLGISGGGDNNTYLISANYFNNEGTSIGTNLNRFSLRINTEAKKGMVTVGENLSITDTKVLPSSSGNPVVDVMRMTPDIAVYDSLNPGGYGYGDESRARTFGGNSIAIQNLVNNRSQNTRLRGNTYIEIAPTKWIKYKSTVGYETSFDEYHSLRKLGNWTLNQPLDASNIYENRARYQSTFFDNLITFDKSFNSHNVNVIAGSSFQHEQYKQLYGQKSNIFISNGEYIDVLNAGSSNPVAGSFYNEIYRISYFGRVNYDYAGKYLFSATLRRDASSQFGPDYRVGYFPSVSAGWRISDEEFFNVKWINNLKLRANYGELGNSAFENFGGNSGINDYIPRLTIFPISVFGADKINYGATQRQLVNPDLTWETKKQLNLGADFAFLKNKLTLSADYFISTTEDVLINYPILLATGNDGGNPVVNAGSLQNRGFEIETSWKDQIGDFKYSVTANITSLQNEVLDLPYGDHSIITSLCKTEIGQPLAMFYLIKTDGLFQSEEEVLAHTNSKGVVIQPDAKPGDVRYIDFDDNGIISAAGDRQIVGSPWAKFEAGLTFDISYKNIFVSVQGYGSFGQKVWNGTRALTERFSDNSNYRKGIDPWTPENTGTNFPRLLYDDERNVMGNIDRWMEDGSFFKIRQLTVGYDFKELGKLSKSISNLRISVTCQNLFTFTKYQGLDPEFDNGYKLEFGVDATNYPSPRSLMFNLSVSF